MSQETPESLDRTSELIQQELINYFSIVDDEKIFMSDEMLMEVCHIVESNIENYKKGKKRWKQTK